MFDKKNQNFLACTLAIFIEYAAWARVGGGTQLNAMAKCSLQHGWGL